MRRALFRNPGISGPSALGAISCANRFASTWDKLPPGMKSAFTPPEYEKLCKAMPNWETSFRGEAKPMITEALMDFGFSRITALSMSASILHHIDDVVKLERVKEQEKEQERILQSIKKEQERILQSIKIPPVKATRSPSSFYERADSLTVATKYITDVVTTNEDGYSAVDPLTGNRGLKFSLLGSSGVKGIGKTEFLLHIAHHRLGEIGKKLNKKLVPVYLSFNGDGMANTNLFSDYLKHHVGRVPGTPARRYLSDAFAHVLLKSCGATVEVTSTISLNEALAYVRKAARLCQDDVLVLLVDEIGALDDGLDVDTIKIVMSCVDDARGKLVVLFSHIDQAVLNTGARLSGREVLPLPLPALHLEAWEYLPAVDEKPMKDWAAANSGLHQLLLCLSGHPRSIFDGFPAALQANAHLHISEIPDEFSKARETIIQKSKMNDTTDEYLSELVPKWLAKQPVRRRELIRDGLLHQLQSDPSVEFLFPLKVHEWANTNRASNAVARHVVLMFNSDNHLGLHTEKWMEGVLLNYEAAKRAAHGTQCLTLGEYYGEVECMDSDLKLTYIRCNPPTTDADSHVSKVKSFDDADMLIVLDQLRRGNIVVSEQGSEVGVEYLVPFFDDNTGAMLVACAQCKYVQEDVKWARMDRKLNNAIERFKKLPSTKDVTFFPVVYTTADRESVPKSEERAGVGVYFVEEELFRFTSRLGILRLHIMKLGEITKKKYFPYSV